MTAPGFLYVSGTTSCATSYDGVTWTTGAMPVGTFGWAAVGWNGSYFCAVGDQSAISPDGQAWTAGGIPVAVNSIAWDGTAWWTMDTLTGGKDESLNGTTWLNPGGAWGGTTWSMIVGGGGTILTVSDSNTCAVWTGTVFVEFSGANVFVLTPPSTWAYHFGVLPNKHWTAAAFGSVTVGGVPTDYVVAVEDVTGLYAVSSDLGASWYTASLPAVEAWTNIAYANGIFVAVGNSHIAVTSPGNVDGWVLHPLPTGAVGVIVAGNVLAAAPTSGRFWTNLFAATEYDT